MEIREALDGDLDGMLRLYGQFKSVPIESADARAGDIWRTILSDRNHHVVVALVDGELVSSCVVIIVPNMTHGGRSYGLIENVVTDEKHRNRGIATSVLNYAKALAVRENCYKLMLMTGSKLSSTLSFYERAGYNRTDKTAFIQWL